MKQEPLVLGNRVHIIVDDRIRIGLEGLDGATVEAIKHAFTHANPARVKLERLGLRGYALSKEPRAIATWIMHADSISVPRGGMGRVRSVLTMAGRARHVTDARIDGDPSLAGKIPPHKLVTGGSLYDFQQQIVDKMLEVHNGFVRAPTGCLVGSTIVTCNRAKLGRRMRLDYVVRRFLGERGCWRSDIETFVRAPMEDGTVRLSKVIGARSSGVRSVYRLALEPVLHRGMHGPETRACEIVGTADHRVMTPIGWVALGTLTRGEFVMVDGGFPSPTKRKPWYKLRVCKRHPFAGRRGVQPLKGGWTVPEHRLVMEASRNGMGLDEFIKAVADGVEGLVFLDPKLWVVHHRDGNPRNNTLENLEVLSEQEHKLAHMTSSLANITSRLVPAKVLRVEYVGEEETFDLEVEAHAFIANGVAVHNSGKSAAALAFASVVNLPTIVVVHNTGLLKQWIANAREQLGLSADEVGVIGAGAFRIRPLTIAMQQTVRAPSTLARVCGVFGNLIADELQTAAAATFAATYDRFPARFRLGMSANERRRDRKEFLIYDLFGDEPIVDVDQDDLIERQIVHDVEVRVVPTAFDSPWYTELKKQLRAAEIAQAKTGVRVPQALVTARMASFDQLVGEMMIDADRQALVASIVAEEVDAGEQVLVLSHRREHCARNDADVSARGIRTGMMIGGAEDRFQFDRALRGLHDGSIRVVAGTYQAIGTGIDLPSVAVGVCTTPIAGSKEGKPFYQQVRGRLCRRAEGKRGARIWYLWDRHVFGLEPLRNLIRWNNTVRVYDGGSWHDAHVWIKGGM
jgi:hypothetical protein